MAVGKASAMLGSVSDFPTRPSTTQEGACCRTTRPLAADWVLQATMIGNGLPMRQVPGACATIRDQRHRARA
jgi:hypothetical protein